MKARSRLKPNYEITPFIILGITIILSLIASSFNGGDPLISPIPEAYAFESYPSQPSPSPKPQFDNEIEQYIYDVFGEDFDDAMAVLSCENKSLNPTAVNHNRNGSIDEGIFQINSIHGQSNMFDYKKNIDYAYKIFTRQGWSPWSCSYVINVKSFWQ